MATEVFWNTNLANEAIFLTGWWKAFEKFQ
jgi:hypothetical protein